MAIDHRNVIGVRATWRMGGGGFLEKSGKTWEELNEK